MTITIPLWLIRTVLWVGGSLLVIVILALAWIGFQVIRSY